MSDTVRTNRPARYLQRYQPPMVRLCSAATIGYPIPSTNRSPDDGGHRGVLGHGDYLSDPEWDHAVAVAAGLEEVGYTARQPTLFDNSWVAGSS